MLRMRIARRVACGFGVALALSGAPHAETLGVGGTGTAQGTVRMLAEAYARQRPDIAFELPRSLGSSGGIKAVAAGALDIATSGRPLKAEEKRQGLVEWAYATTPFLLATSHPTFRENLTNADVVAIFSLQRTAWPDGSTIRVVLRPESDADSEFLNARFPGIETGLKAARGLRTIPIANTDQDNIEEAERLVGSFAASSLAILRSEGRSKVVALPLDGVEPTLANLESGAYRYAKTLYFVTLAPKAAAQDFLAFVAGPEGQRVLREAGNAPIAPTR